MVWLLQRQNKALSPYPQASVPSTTSWQASWGADRQHPHQPNPETAVSGKKFNQNTTTSACLSIVSLASPSSCNGDHPAHKAKIFTLWEQKLANPCPLEWYWGHHTLLGSLTGKTVGRISPFQIRSATQKLQPTSPWFCQPRMLVAELKDQGCNSDFSW